MAATQAENQPNEVNSDPVPRDHPTDLNNSGLQNGTEKNGGRGSIGSDSATVNAKAKSPGQGSHPEMSQYRPEHSSASTLPNNEPHANSVENAGKIHDGKAQYIHQNDPGSIGQGDPNYKVPDGGPPMQGYYGRGGYHHTPSEPHNPGAPQVNSNDSNVNPISQYNQYNSPQMRHAYSGGGKGMPMVTPRPPSAASNYGPGPQRFLSGQSISQQTGPTPTLNQLLQSNQPQHYQNSYGDYPMKDQSYQQWGPQRPPTNYNPQGPGPTPYRNQHPSGAGPRPGGPQQPPYYTTVTNSSAPPGPGAYPGPQAQGQPPQPQGPPGSVPAAGHQGPPQPPQPSPSGQQYPPYPGRYPTPPGPGHGGPGRQPFPPHQMSSPYCNQQLGPNSQQQPGYSDLQQQRPTWPPNQQVPHPPSPSHHPPQPPQSPSHVSEQHPPPKPSPGPQASPSHPAPSSPQPSPQTAPPPSPHQQQQQQQNFPPRPQQASTPNAQAPDQGELTGANSNDSNSGLAGPGTPNSGMRPTPSPTGSTGSRSMSPAVGQQNIPMPPRPSSGQSDSGAPARLSHSPLAPAGPYPQPPHGAHPYKTPPHVPPYSQSGQQYPQGNYSPRPGPQGMQYGPAPGPYPQPQPNNVPAGPGPYPGRPVTNHAPHSQYSGYQGWGPQGTPPSMMNQSGPPGIMTGPGNHLPPNGKGSAQPQPTPPPNQSGNASGPRPHTPPHYLKQHLQHKMGFTGPGPGMPPSPGPPQSYPTPGMGPPGGLHHHLGSQSAMGPPPSGLHHPGMGPPPPQNMGPPVPPSSTPNSHLGHEGGSGATGVGPGGGSGAAGASQAGPGQPTTVSGVGSGPGPGAGVATGAGGMPPPSSTPNSHSIPHAEDAVAPHDNGITTTAVGPTTHVTPANLGSVTSVVTTGPDGTPMDEGSQQSTLSNASAASGEDPTCTPGKSRKDFHSHPTTPQSTAPSPGAASVTSMHEDYDVNSSPTSWPRTPNSPVFNSHLSQDSYRSAKKPDSLGKLYEMDDSPERRHWLDRLLSFMEERGSPITACPTISKNPLDLFRLYLYVKDRGGFMEVTKNKTWKDIAGLLGIGASSSAAYTLRKHYTKNLLAYECHFDRGGIDPQPIINQVEAQSKKKGNKSASVPSPGSSNSQDSFPPVGSGGGSMDGYSGYGYPPGSTPDYSGPNQRPTQTSAPSPHPGMQQPGYPGQGGYPGQYPDQYGRGQEYNQQYPQQGYPPSRPGPVYPQYPPPGPENDNRSYAQGGTGTPPGGPAPPPPPPTGSNQDPYGRNYQSNYSAGRPGYSTPPGQPTSAPGPGSYPPPPAQQQEYYRQDQMGQQCSSYPVSQGSTYQTSQVSSYPNSQLARQLVAPQNAKSPYQNYGPSGGVTPAGAAPPPTGTTGQPNKTMPPPAPQPRRHPDFAKDQPPYQPYPQQRPGYGNWPNSQYRGQYPQQWSGPGPRPQWEPRYPPPSPGGPAPSPYPPPQPVQQWGNSMPVAGVGQSSPLRPAGPRVQYRPDGKPYPPPQPVMGKGAGGQQVIPQKREIVFPTDSVEAVLPVLHKRRRLTKNDVTPLEAWRIMMALRSGQLCETTWALDVLNILLFDDTTVTYFGLTNLPGLLDILLEHWRKSLDDVFEPTPDQQYEPKGDVDLGEVTDSIPKESTKIFKSVPNFSSVTIKGKPVVVVPRDDLFIRDDRKSWDNEGEAGSEDESPDVAPAKYIISPFRGEMLTLPFARRLETVKKVKTEPENVVNNINNNNNNNNINNNINNKNNKINSCSNNNNNNTMNTSNVSNGNNINNNNVNNINNNIKKEVDTDERLNKLRCKDVENSKRNLVDVKKENSDEQILDEKDNEKEDKSESGEENGAGGGAGAGEEAKKRTEKSDVKTKEESDEKPKLNIRDPQGILKRRRMSDCEDECYARDDSSLLLAGEGQDALARRCICLSTIIRNLSFVPGNEPEMARSGVLLTVLGRLLLLHHEHPPRQTQQRNYDREEDADFADSCSSLQGENEWWWDYLHHIRENVLVTCANICGHMDLASHLEEISRPIVDGLLHWAVCPAAAGQDPFPTVGPSSSLSPQRLALEALCKLCVTDTNVDLLVATPPYSRLERLCGVLSRLLCRGEDQVLREFAVNLLHYLSACDSSVARTVALQTPCVSLLLSFIEQAEQSAMGVANQHGINALRDNPDSMGTSLDMLRRAAATLFHLSRHPDNRPLFVQQEARLLQLVMSQILDQQVASVISRVLFQCSRTS